MESTNRKRALLVSGSVILLCMTIIVGMTWALFTDTRTLTNHLKAGDLMRASGYAEDYLRGKFLKVTKTSPVKFLNHIRVKNAGDMLLSTELSINEVAQKCGFLDMAYFSKIFKSHFGISPRKYKNSSKGQL